MIVNDLSYHSMYIYDMNTITISRIQDNEFYTDSVVTYIKLCHYAYNQRQIYTVWKMIWSDKFV